MNYKIKFINFICRCFNNLYSTAIFNGYRINSIILELISRAHESLLPVVAPLGNQYFMIMIMVIGGFDVTRHLHRRQIGNRAHIKETFVWTTPHPLPPPRGGKR